MNTFSMETVFNVFGISLMGIVIFAIAFAIMVWLSPFSVKKEIEVDQNTSLGIIYGSVFIALAIIISAAVS
jgi:putative membrane protein